MRVQTKNLCTALVRGKPFVDPNAFLSFHFRRLRCDKDLRELRELRVAASEFDWMPRIHAEITILKCLISVFDGRSIGNITRPTAENILKKVFRPMEEWAEFKKPNLPGDLKTAMKRVRRAIHPDLKRKNTPQEEALLADLSMAEAAGDEQKIRFLILLYDLTVSGENSRAALHEYERATQEQQDRILEEFIPLFSAAQELQNLPFAQGILTSHIEDLKRIVRNNFSCGKSKNDILAKLPEGTREGAARFLINLGILSADTNVGNEQGGRSDTAEPA
ncbi:hypothetical protein A2276_03890 [candidate division WOR-1 bacterium RIFOXYA12_FULL_43_27]|uniref:Uncharacterized protein n=1 Tax=candidate division WOR-1 bacterium RIFOXYC2_FULL_46_14 TaxID=1802587 RepID=A0A1F4U716_UNCSA|nr:MAG: hypothetical protein A2276_03890 [candidate division WOR-1 bacterium RIFOXYA12_FULL_43_27]OGC19165.1 MAG: hypothetical protein A2292_00445 [candidate division WOR-1 bacterium RIFOXYB2_FULL_46_45]OGC30154.1 MAG: hypothetical protein A2232_00445 [candidate division WOR-1 bacterium RIFOXYA2_FULL_46_56]OGC40756.1 MAG: hypothetical protein A2438_00450 [candidate division WOR-1 bacterium RIFOXYC2_FULL_46_14]